MINVVIKTDLVETNKNNENLSFEEDLEKLLNGFLWMVITQENILDMQRCIYKLITNHKAIGNVPNCDIFMVGYMCNYTNKISIDFDHELDRHLEKIRELAIWSSHKYKILFEARV